MLEKSAQGERFTWVRYKIKLVRLEEKKIKSNKKIVLKGPLSTVFNETC